MMLSKIKNALDKLLLLSPLTIVAIATVYYLNWFERLYSLNEKAYYLPIYKELQISIGTTLLITGLLNWALVGFYKHLNSGSCKIKRNKKNVGK